MLDKYTRTRTTGRQMIRAKTTNTIHKSINRGEGGVGVRAAATGGLRGPRDCRSDGAVGRSVGCLPRPPSACVSLRAEYHRRKRGPMLPRCNSRRPQSVLCHDPFILTNPSWIFYGGESPILRNHNSPAAAMTPVHSFPGEGFRL